MYLLGAVRFPPLGLCKVPHVGCLPAAACRVGGYVVAGMRQKLQDATWSKGARLVVSSCAVMEGARASLLANLGRLMMATTGYSGLWLLGEWVAPTAWCCGKGPHET